MIAEHSQSVDRKIEHLCEKFDLNIKAISRSLEEKKKELITATGLHTTELKLRSDIRVLVYQMKDKDSQISLLKDQLKTCIDTISRKTSEVV